MIESKWSEFSKLLSTEKIKLVDIIELPQLYYCDCGKLHDTYFILRRPVRVGHIKPAIFFYSNNDFFIDSIGCGLFQNVSK